MGRKPTIDPQKQAKICAMVTVGCSLRRAALLCDCNEQTLRLFARRDKAFRDQLKQAELTRELIPLNYIREASTKNWRAAAWLLKNIGPDAWGDHRANSIPVVEHGEALHAWVEVLGEVLRKAVKRPDDKKRVHEELKDLARRLKKREEICNDPFLTPKQRQRRSNYVNGPFDRGSNPGAIDFSDQPSSDS